MIYQRERKKRLDQLEIYEFPERIIEIYFPFFFFLFQTWKRVSMKEKKDHSGTSIDLRPFDPAELGGGASNFV
jgi:hypothetical protein